MVHCLLKSYFAKRSTPDEKSTKNVPNSPLPNAELLVEQTILRPGPCVRLEKAEGNVGGSKLAHGIYPLGASPREIWNQAQGEMKSDRLRTLKSQVSSYLQKVEAVSSEFDPSPTPSPIPC
ncbi:hypothetical protein E4U19_002978 [Claviceps sp. Clav32 group G5]|nr:hypothetical protein E4U19_002978 [Claviceps sp. Clav32 group G5]